MIVKNGQNIFDICLQEFGDLEYVFDIIKNNDITLNSNLQSGQELNIDNTGKINRSITEYIGSNNIILANNLLSSDITVETSLSIQWPVYVDLLEAININKVIQV